jgi:hypothetical protein
VNGGRNPHGFDPVYSGNPLHWLAAKPFLSAPGRKLAAEFRRIAANFAPITRGQLRKSAAQQNRRAFVQRKVVQIKPRFRCGVGHG